MSLRRLDPPLCTHPTSLCPLVGGGGCLGSVSQLLMLGQNLLKTKIPYVQLGGGGGGGSRIHLPTFDTAFQVDYFPSTQVGFKSRFWLHCQFSFFDFSSLRTTFEYLKCAIGGEFIFVSNWRFNLDHTIQEIFYFKILPFSSSSYIAFCYL